MLHVAWLFQLQLIAGFSLVLSNRPKPNQIHRPSRTAAAARKPKLLRSTEMLVAVALLRCAFVNMAFHVGPVFSGSARVCYYLWARQLLPGYLWLADVSTRALMSSHREWLLRGLYLMIGQVVYAIPCGRLGACCILGNEDTKATIQKQCNQLSIICTSTN